MTTGIDFDYDDENPTYELPRTMEDLNKILADWQRALSDDHQRCVKRIADCQRTIAQMQSRLPGIQATFTQIEELRNHAKKESQSQSDAAPGKTDAESTD